MCVCIDGVYVCACALMVCMCVRVDCMFVCIDCVYVCACCRSDCEGVCMGEERGEVEARGHLIGLNCAREALEIELARH